MVSNDLLLLLVKKKWLSKTSCMLKMMRICHSFPMSHSVGFGIGPPSVLINTKLPHVEAEPIDVANSEQPVENIADSGGSPVRQEKLVIHAGSVAGRIKDRKCRTKCSTKSHVKHKLVQVGSSSRSTRQRASPAKARCSMFLALSDNKEGRPDVLELGHIDNLVDAELLDLHDRCYARHAVVENVVNQRARELLKVVDQIKGECEVLKEREKARDKECEDLKANCKAPMADYDNNLAVNILRKKIKSLSGEVKEHKASLERMLLESKKWTDY
ncbi:hypothetical protein Tco_1519844 [Tanacetum coccineum]